MNARKNFGPYTEGFVKIPYNDLAALKEFSLQHHTRDP